MLFGDFVFDISLLQTILFALFAIMTLFQGRLSNHSKFLHSERILIFNSCYFTFWYLYKINFSFADRPKNDDFIRKSNF
ncbi:hypothetical protein BV917_11750 [Leptospira santarosai serovar Guaricura]|nr:hypothetical protein BV917_11750 [Leptospira santarosai serovar Guaricura]